MVVKSPYEKLPKRLEVIKCLMLCFTSLFPFVLFAAAPSTIDAPVSGSGWTHNQHMTGFHDVGKGVGDADDTYAWDTNFGSGSDDDGLSVYSIEGGTIHTLNDWGGSSEGQLLINHTTTSGQWSSGYLHMKNIVKKSGTVLKGEKIGEVSNTSSGTVGIHLHFAVYSTHGKANLTSVDAQIFKKTYGVTIVPILSMLLLEREELKPPVILAKLNDTGITFGGNYLSGNNVTCIGNDTSVIPSVPLAPQDCHYGRDATHNDDTDGHAGFSYTKLDANGNLLPASATVWNCVKDNVTGLIWEVKTDDNSAHDKDNTYRWGGKTHLGNFGTEFYNDWDSLIDGSNNGNGLCGYTEWRVPTISELQNLVNLNQVTPTIDTEYFPNMPNSNLTADFYFWSASPYSNNSNNAKIILFVTGSSSHQPRSNSFRVRLVNSVQ